MSHGQRFLVQRDALASTCIESLDLDLDTPLAPDQVRMRIEHFALTANNITYAVFGDALQYWRFFPTPEGSFFGCVPVWGFGVIEASGCEGVAVGERLYGYWPMATHAWLQPASITPDGLTDASPHRRELPAVYNRYRRVKPASADDEGVVAVLHPLFATAWLIDDFLHQADDFGAATLLLSSASSKTAMATAFCLKHSARAARVVGATSPPRLAATRGLGLYDRVIAYDELATLDANERAVYIDFAGDADFRRRVHGHWRDALGHSASIGGTHHSALGPGRGLPGPKPTLFFAPEQMRQRSAPPPAGLGRAGLQQAIDAAWIEFIAVAAQGGQPWVRIEHRRGANALSAAWLEVLEGRADSNRGLMLSF
jgi:Protein of unknown function (DUF2855)